MNLNEMAKEIHENAVAHGFYNPPPTFGNRIALMHSELSEALEEYRDGKPNVYFMKQDRMSAAYGDYDTDICTDMAVWKGEKPEGIATELADCVIRILDYSDSAGHDLNQYPMDYNSILDVKEFGDFITLCHACLTYAYCEGKAEGEWIIPQLLHDCIIYIFKWAKENNVDMVEVIRIKHEFNKTRPYKHGGKII